MNRAHSPAHQFVGAFTFFVRRSNGINLQVLLAKRPHDSNIEHSLGVFRIDLQRMLELLQCEVYLLVVVIAHTQIGADVHVFRIERERLGVLLDGLGMSFGVEVQISQLCPSNRVLRSRSATLRSACTCASSSFAGAEVLGTAPDDAGAAADSAAGMFARSGMDAWPCNFRRNSFASDVEEKEISPSDEMRPSITA